MPATQSRRVSDSQQKKLRASCDGCYQTKIKCNKARPMCSRCLIYGIDCVYSPSSRSGRAKKNPNANTPGDCNPDGSDYPRCQENSEHKNNNSDLRPPFLYIPQAYLSEDTPPNNCEPTIMTPGLGLTFDQRSIFDAENTVSGMGSVSTSNPMESYDCDLWWADLNTPATKHENNFDDTNTLPLTSDFLLSSPSDILYSQYYNPQLDFSSYSFTDISFSPTYSPTTSSPLLPDCVCRASYSQDFHTLHDSACPASI